MKLRAVSRDKLIKDKEMAYITKKLVILDKDVPLNLDWKRADVTNTDGNKVAQKLAELEFKSLLAQLPDDMKQSAEDLVSANSFKPTAKVEPVATKAQLAKMDLEGAKSVVIESSVAGAVNTDLQFALISPNPKLVYAVQIGGVSVEDLAEKLNKDLSSTKLIAYDSKYSLKSLLQAGVNEIKVEHDVRMGAYLINSLTKDQSLAGLAGELGYEGDALNDVSPEEMLERASVIASVVWALHESQLAALSKLEAVEKLAREVEWPLVNVLAKGEIEGVGLDTVYLASMSDQLGDRISDIEQEIYGHADQEFNVSSPAQLAEVLFDRLGLPTKGVKKGKTGYSTAAKELEKLRGLHPISIWCPSIAN